MKRQVIFMVFIGVYYFSFSQNKKLDSLWSVYTNKTQADTNRLKAIYDIARSYMGNNPDTAIVLEKQQLLLAQKAKQKYFFTLHS